MIDFTKWKRKSFGDPFGVPPQREVAEREVDQDVQKPIQQLMCDVHEHAMMPTKASDSIKWMMVRMVSMNGRVALEHERVGRELIALNITLVRLTKILVWFTVVLAILTVVLVYDAIRR